MHRMHYPTSALVLFVYLLFIGFYHSAFTFGNESMIAKSNNINHISEIPHGCLIDYLQKGLLHKEIETHLSEVFAWLSFVFVCLSLPISSIIIIITIIIIIIVITHHLPLSFKSIVHKLIIFSS